MENKLCRRDKMAVGIAKVPALTRGILLHARVPTGSYIRGRRSRGRTTLSPRRRTSQRESWLVSRDLRLERRSLLFCGSEWNTEVMSARPTGTDKNATNNATSRLLFRARTSFSIAISLIAACCNRSNDFDFTRWLKDFLACVDRFHDWYCQTRYNS